MRGGVGGLWAGVVRLLPRFEAVRRRPLAAVLAGLILGLGSVTVSTGLVRASERDGLAGFFEMLFGGPRPQPSAPPPAHPPRYANLPRPHLHHVPRPVPLAHTPRPRIDPIASMRGWAPRPRPRAVAQAIVAARAAPRPQARATAVPTAGQTVCVRLCDGYLFPLGALGGSADLPVHRAACAAACPNAATSVYTMAAGETELERAVSPQGMPYRASALANVYRQRRVENCACQPDGAAVHLPIGQDMTLRPGDAVATAGGAGVVTRATRDRLEFADYRRAHLPRGQVRRIEAKVGASRTRAPVRTAAVADGAEVVRVAADGDAERAVRVVSPSPYR